MNARETKPNRVRSARIGDLRITETSAGSVEVRLSFSLHRDGQGNRVAPYLRVVDTWGDAVAWATLWLECRDARAPDPIVVSDVTWRAVWADALKVQELSDIEGAESRRWGAEIWHWISDRYGAWRGWGTRDEVVGILNGVVPAQEEPENANADTEEPVADPLGFAVAAIGAELEATESRLEELDDEVQKLTAERAKLHTALSALQSLASRR